MKKNKRKILLGSAVLLSFLIGCSSGEDGIQNSSASVLNSSAFQQKFVPGRAIIKYKDDATFVTKNSSNVSVSKKMSKMSYSQRSAYFEKSTNVSVQSVKTNESIYEEKKNQPIFSKLYEECQKVSFVKFDTDDSEETLSIIETLKNDPNIEFAEPDYIVSASTIPNDTYYQQQWGNSKINLEKAWDTTTGDQRVIVAVLDTGVDYTHSDLSGNLLSGYDFANDDSDPTDDNGHGTHVSGIIAAVGNNSSGIAGVAWGVHILPVKFLYAGGYGYTSAAIEAIDYAIAHSANIINASYGGAPYSESEHEAIDRAKEAGILFVAAAGNNATDNDTSPHYPSSYDNTNIISVAATDSSDVLASFSNYGLTTVDVAAPGVGIYSTYMGNTYLSLSGTSMATPYVSGLAALIKSKNLDLTYDQIKQGIIESCDKISNLSSNVASGGRINAEAALELSGCVDVDYRLPIALKDSYGALGAKFVDIDHDGFKDLIYYRFYSSDLGYDLITKGAYKNTGSGWTALSASYNLPYPLMNLGTDIGNCFVDVDHDGYEDFVCRNSTGNGAYKNTGTGWTALSSAYRLPVAQQDSYGSMGIRFVDVDHDGFKDLVYHRTYQKTVSYSSTPITVTEKGAYKNTGSGWTALSSGYSLPYPTVKLGVDLGEYFIDLDHDGYEDFVYYNAVTGEKNAYRNTGTGWEAMSTSFILPAAQYDSYGLKEIRFVDVDHDGFKDLIFHRQYSTTINYVPTTVIEKGAYKNTGTGWEQLSEIYVPEYQMITSEKTNGYDFVDFTHNGYEDFIYKYSASGFFLNICNGWY